MKCLQPVPLVWAALCLLPTWAQAVACNYSLPPSNPDHIYAVHDDGTVTDTRTSLMWKLCPEGQTYHGGGGSCTGSSTVMTWEQALNAAHNSSFAGHSDWRVPSIKELRSLVEQCRTYPSINEQVFGAASVINAWSGTPAPTPSALPANWKLAYYVNFQHGHVTGEQRSSQKSVWLVRAGQSLAPVPRLGAVSLAAAPQATSAVVQGHSVQGGTGYWMVVPAGAPAPTAALVQAGAGYGGVSVAQQGSQQMAAGASTTISLTGLAPGTAYDFYAVAEVGGQRSALAHVAFATPAPIDGSCGSASGVASASAPVAASLCSAGTATAVAGNAGQWQWGCTGIDGGTNTAASACTASYASQSLSLSATPTALVVGSASTLAASSTADLPVELSASGPCTLDGSTARATGAGSCTITARQAGTGDSGTLRYLAAADVVLDIPLSPAPVAGQCGSDSGRTDLTAPPAQLCSAGSASTLGGNGSPWSWTCNGLHGGDTHSCSASLQTYAIAASASPPTGGSVQCTPNPAAHGQDAACSASAHAGYRFTAWSGDCSGAAACTLTGIQAAHSVQALFARLPALVSLQELAATPTGISMSVVSDSPATAWWLAVAAGSAAPTPAQIKAQPDAYGNPAVTVLAKGSAGPLPAGQATAFEIGALQPGTSYDLYLVVEDGQGALSLPAHVTLATPVVDSVPDAFAFAARTGVALSTVVTSEAVTIAGLNSPAAISVEHGEYQIDAGPWSTSPATVEQGQSVRLRHTSSAAYASSSTSTLTIGGVSGSFTSTTQAASPAPEPEPQEPPPPPPPPAPDPQEPPAPTELHITTPGTVQLTEPSRPIVIAPGAEGATLVLPGAGSTPVALALTLNGQALAVRALPGTQLQVALHQGEALLVLRVLQGWAELTASRAGQPLVLAGAVLLRAAGAGTRVEGVPLASGVLAGALLAPPGQLPQLDARGLLAGERLRIDGQGRVSAIELGTVGAAGAGAGPSGATDVPPGDTLALPDLGAQVRFAAAPVQLQGAVARLATDAAGAADAAGAQPPAPAREAGNVPASAAGWPAVLQQHARALAQALAPGAAGSVQFDRHGLMLWRLGPWTAALAPLAAVQIDVRQPDGLTYTPEGLVQIAHSGLVLTLAPSVADWPGLVQALAAAAPQASVQFTPEGVLVLRLDGARWVLRPALLAQSGAPQPGASAAPAWLDADADGTLVLQGPHAQRLPWALADYARARAVLHELLPGAQVQSSPAPEGALQVQLPEGAGAWALLPQPQLRSTWLEPGLAALFANGQRWAVDGSGQLLLRLPTGVQALAIVPLP